MIKIPHYNKRTNVLIQEANSMEELLTLSCNFGEPVGLLVGDQRITGIVEEIDEDRVRLAGEWYPIADIGGVAS